MSSPQTKTETTQSLTGNSWVVTGVAVLLGVIGLVLLFPETVRTAVVLWANRPSYNHAFLILPIALYLIWDRRHRLAEETPRPSAWGLPVVVAFAFLWLVSDAADVSEGRHIVFVGLIQGLLLSAVGPRGYKLMLLPFCYLWLMVPTGTFLLAGLQGVATALSTALIGLTQIPLFVEGNTIQVPTGLYVVAPGCAGLNFLLSALAVGVLFAYFVYHRPMKRVAFVAALLVTAVLANAVRIFGIIVLAELTDRKIDITDDHILYGWGFFVVVLFVAGLAGLLFADPHESDSAPSPARSGGTGSGTTGLRAVASVVAAVALAAAAPAYSAYAGAVDVPSAEVEVSLPPPPDDWSPAAPVREWRPRFESSDGSLFRAFERGRDRVEVFVSYYWRQREDHELITSGNHPLGGGEWAKLDVRSRAVELDGRPLEVVEARIGRRHARRTVWYWYWVDGRFTNNRTIAKLFEAKATLFGGDRRAAFIAVSAEEASGPRETRAVLSDFLKRMESLGEHLSAARLTAGKR